MDQASNAELDRLVSEHVMGWHIETQIYAGVTDRYYVDEEGYSKHRVSHWHPARNIAQAWQVLEKFPWPHHRVQLMTTVTGKWLCEIVLRGGDGPVRSGAAQTAARAICIAALSVMGISPSD